MKSLTREYSRWLDDQSPTSLRPNSWAKLQRCAIAGPEGEERRWAPHDKREGEWAVTEVSDWSRPPGGISIADFFQTWLPAAFLASGRRAPPNAPLVRATISGAGGGGWDIQCEDTRLMVEAVSPAVTSSSRRPATDAAAAAQAGAAAAGPALPDVWLRQAAGDFKAAFDGDPDLPVLLPPGWSALDLLFLDPRDVDLLAQVSGRVVVEVMGRRARRWAFDVAFGKAGVTAGRARTTIRLDGTTFEGLQNGSIPPMQALLGGGLVMDGDRALAMQLLLLFGSRLNRR